mmetsp:Transcript_6803/g.24184  ORF Transcript_6803/g.24184 Transcript_6803/m.24184 type:complete len:449 (-) Transcript_6803:113-1459(-)
MSATFRVHPVARCAPRATSSLAGPVRASGTAEGDVRSYPNGKRFDAREFRRSLHRTGRYTRRTWEDEESLAKMEAHGVGYSKRGLVAKMQANGNRWTCEDVDVVLAASYGFCWGVERAVQMAYEARKVYPKETMYITNEIIHNPSVNQRLKEMDVRFVQADERGNKDFGSVQAGDVVILPAFGASVMEMQLLNDRGVNIVDTTCPWVAKVWNAVDVQKKKRCTSVIHGKWNHEETVATASFASDYLVVKDMEEAEYVANYILNGGDKQAFLEKFENAMSDEFDPDVHLERVGVANQTTMLKGETERIGKLFEKTMLQKHGPTKLQEHYVVMDTICDATQERQDAMYELVQQDVDMIVVVGGFNSSNTSHLQEISEEYKIPSYWVDTPGRIDVENNAIAHRLSYGELVTTKDWLKPGPLKVGITSGASTPDRVVEDVLEALFETKEKHA